MYKQVELTGLWWPKAFYKLGTTPKGNDYNK